MIWDYFSFPIILFLCCPDFIWKCTPFRIKNLLDFQKLSLSKRWTCTYLDPSIMLVHKKRLNSYYRFFSLVFFDWIIRWVCISVLTSETFRCSFFRHTVFLLFFSVSRYCFVYLFIYFIMDTTCIFFFNILVSYCPETYLNSRLFF